MNLGRPLIEYSPTDITELRRQMLQQPASFWLIDRETRVKLAGDRPGNAVFFYNDMPGFVRRSLMNEVKSGFVNVIRSPQRPLFGEIERLIARDVKPHFSNCDVMRIQLAELPPGQIIAPHYDAGILALIHRLHIPLVTHPAVKFIISGKTFYLKEGVLYDLNNVVTHSVENNSDVMRIHILIDMLPHSVARARYHDTEESMLAAIAA